jgi:hypothetical protein
MKFDFTEPATCYAVETHRNLSETGLIIDIQENGTFGTRNLSRFETARSDCDCFCFNPCARPLSRGGVPLGGRTRFAPPRSRGEERRRDGDDRQER